MERGDLSAAGRGLRIGALALAAALFAAAAWFRVAGTLAEPLWLDEAYSAYAADKGWHFLWQVVPRYETHPPFYYSLLRLWTLVFGDSVGALRALGMACAIATLPVLMLVARELARLLGVAAGTRWALALALLALAGLAPALVEMAREVRPYPVLILVYATALYALLRLARTAALDRRIGRGPFLLYLFCLELVLWLHNLGPLYAAALGLALLVLVGRSSLPRSDWLLIVGGHVLVAALWLPALLILLDQAPTWVHSTWLRFDSAKLTDRLAVLYAAPGDIAMTAGAVLAVLGVAALWRRREGRRVAAALLLLALLPVASSLLLSIVVAPVFIVRTMTAVTIPSLLLLAVGAAGQRGIWRWPALGALLVLAGQMLTIDVNARKGAPMQDWYGTVAWLAERYRPGDQLWSYPNEGALPFDRAARDRGLAIVNRPIPTPVPSLGVGGWNPTGSRGVVSLPRDRLRTIAQAPEARAIPTIWLLRLGANAYDKGDVLLDELRAGRVEVGRWEKGPIDLIGLRRADLPPVAPAQQPQP